MSRKLDEMVESLRGYEMTPDEVDEQRVSFAYGNAPKEDGSTKEDVRSAILTATVPKK